MGMANLRKALITKEICIEDTYESIEIFQRKSDLIQAISNQLMIHHVVHKVIKQDQKENIARDISVVYTTRDDRKKQQLKECLKRIANNTNTKIISYSIANHSQWISELPSFTIDI